MAQADCKACKFAEGCQQRAILEPLDRVKDVCKQYEKREVK